MVYLAACRGGNEEFFQVASRVNSIVPLPARDAFWNRVLFDGLHGVG